MKLWTHGDAREIELETPNLVWLQFTVSSISVPNLTSFPQAVLWAAIDFERKKRKKQNNKNANGYNRCLHLRCSAPNNNRPPNKNNNSFIH